MTPVAQTIDEVVESLTTIVDDAIPRDRIRDRGVLT